MKKLIVLAVFGFLALTSCGNKGDLCAAEGSNHCACEKIYAPVCGCNEQTYDNACMADCAGVPSYTSGECP